MFLENFSLKKINSFGIDVVAQYFAPFNSIEALQQLLEYKKSIFPHLSFSTSSQSNLSQKILGGGSNILLTKNLDGFVFKNEIQGIEIIREKSDYVYVKAGAGENWHRLVMYCLEHNLAGMENLSLIPGNVGASPMQNIGAYGVELQDVFYELEAFDLVENKLVTFNKVDCEFGYRESIFKSTFKDKFVIISVTFQLNKTPKFNIKYGAIEQELNKMGVTEISIRAISQAVINIRKSKLPDPAIIGNAGSFFKNPVIPAVQFKLLQSSFSNIIGYPADGQNTKLAAGWLIEQCGWKGYRKGDAGCHINQALVLVNYGNATGAEIYDLSSKIIESVQNKFGVPLQREVNIF